MRWRDWFFSVLSSCSSRFFFPYLFLFRVLLIWFVFLQLLAIEKRLADFSDRQQILLKTPTMQLNKVYHGKLNRQNRNKMGEDRQRKLTANHQQFNDCIKQLIGLGWNLFWWSEQYQKKKLMMIMSFSPFSFCWKFDYFQSKWRVARYKATIWDDTK